jgi:hypothetical protein
MTTFFAALAVILTVAVIFGRKVAVIPMRLTLLFLVSTATLSLAGTATETAFLKSLKTPALGTTQRYTKNSILPGRNPQ